ncbi:MAG: hypothetical protein IPK82_10440 [Polyangiaceae bacterium]|nr:hypothetical protein [Polyangiaceae bacterium]
MPADENGRICTIALIQAHGTTIGSLDHASASAQAFHRSFLGRKMTREQFGDEDLGAKLIGRPLCNLACDDIPAWGWLSHEELRRLRLNPPEETREDAIGEWLEDLRDLLTDARVAGQDLVTVYV